LSNLPPCQLLFPPEKLQDSIKWRNFVPEIINTISSNEKTAVDDADSHCSNVRRNDVADIVPD
jgi:hypothetical protein